MTPGTDGAGWSSSTPRPRWIRYPFSALLLVLALAQVPTVSAHGGTVGPGVPRWLTLVPVLAGVVLSGAAVGLKRRGSVSPTAALSGAFVGIALAAVGAILFEGLSPDSTYAASSMPFPRSWYAALALVGGLAIVVLSFVVGWVRWPSRPRYTMFGMLAGLWIGYPHLVPGPYSYTHPVGYALVVGTPILVAYILWKDASAVLRAVLGDPVARRFGVGVGVLVAAFFVSVTGYLSFFPDPNVPHESSVVVLPVIYQLVLWPTLEVALPHVPLFAAVSPGLVLVVGTLSVLIGLNAAVIARQWRVEESAGLTEGTAGTAAVVGSCTCGCCGPIVAKVALLAVGPSIAAPLYWVFVDPASPLSSLFVVGSLALFTGSLVYTVEAGREPDGSNAIAPAD